MGGASVLVPAALALFVPGTYLSFAKLGPARGAIAAILGGWLFLPVFDDALQVPILRSKAMLVGAVVLGMSLLLDFRSWSRLKLGWLDLPVAVYCATPFGASISNGLGPYDGLHASLGAILGWGAPYLLGRLYLGDARGVRQLAHAVVVAGLAYVPLCLWEIRMSPQLHASLYGYSTFGYFGQAIRFGGYRPVVFMSHGLMTSMFMAVATLVAAWTWRTQARRQVFGVPSGAVFAVLAVTTVLCKSTGALALLTVGLATLELTRRSRKALWLVMLAALPPAYCAARATGWQGRDLVALAGKYVNAARAESLEFRMQNEDILVEKALRRPWLGWGGWGRSRVYDEEGRDISVTDGLWVLALGTTGLAGLVALLLVLELPSLALLRRFPARHWADPRLAPAAALATAALLWSVDGLFNAMVTPLSPVMAGALVHLAELRTRARGPARARPAPGSHPTPLRSTRQNGHAY
jgi:hypothetical protein